MGKLQDLSSVLTDLYDQPLLGPKPDQPNDALWMVIILFYQDVLLASA